jgi:phosphate-selective porin OprO and OprP
MKFTLRFSRAAFLVLLVSLTSAECVEQTSAFDQLWSHAMLYEDEQNPYLQEFKLRGRYQGQYWDVDADQGSQSGWEDRRSRFGFDAKLFDKRMEVRLDFQSDDGFDNFYNGLVDANIRWKPTDWLSITAGKQQPYIAEHDWLVSNSTMPTFERSQIFNQLGINRATGLALEGKAADFTWRTGVYSNDTPTSTGGSGSFGDGEFGDFNGGVSFTLGAGYDFKDTLDCDKAEVWLDWLHSDRQDDDTVLGKYDDVISSTLWVKKGPAALVIEGFYARGGDGTNSDVFGFYLEPTYDILPKTLQLVGRYSYANSEGPLGVLGQARYERTVAINRGLGDSYHSVYAGAQYFIYGDKLKLMAGAEWAWLNSSGGNSYEGVTLLSGVRFAF